MHPYHIRSISSGVNKIDLVQVEGPNPIYHISFKKLNYTVLRVCLVGIDENSRNEKKNELICELRTELWREDIWKVGEGTKF